jgi:hypothetical protein
MLCRKWRRGESHLLGKTWATGFFIWIQTLLLGNALPLIDTGSLFPSRGFTRMVRMMNQRPPDPMEAVAMSGIYGLVTLALIFILVAIVTPSTDSQLRGWRRARKQGDTSLSFFSDAATGFWAAIVMALAGAGGWFLFTRGLVESRWFPGHEVPIGVFGLFAAVLLSAGVGYQALLEAKGGRHVTLTAIFVGVVPVMIGAVMAVSENLAPIAVWLIGMSPLSLPVYASSSLLSLAELPEGLSRAMPRAFQFWLFVAILTCCWLVKNLWVARRAMARKVLDAPAAEP